MNNNEMSAHLLRNEVEAYLSGALSPERETQVEEHLADCAACTQISRALMTPDPVFENWTARAHGQAYLREAVNAALSGVEQHNPLLRHRAAEWRTKWTGLAEAAVHLVLDAPRAVSGMVATQVSALARPGATLALAAGGPVLARGALRTRGAVRTRGAGKGPHPGPPLVPASTTADRAVHLRRDGRALVVQFGGVPSGGRPPLVMLVSVDETAEHHEQESVRTAGGQHVARFDEVGTGTYLVLIEPIAE